MTKLKILVIIGSTRSGRYGEKPAHWILGKLAGHPELEAELVDLRDWPLPLFDAERAPARVTNGDYGHPLANQWAAKIASADGFIVTAAEYNHGYTAVVKNALDWCFREWSRKPITFIGYGTLGGVRAVEQLRQVAVELEMAPIRHAVHLRGDIYMATMKLAAPADPALFAAAEPQAKTMIEDLTWWARALRAARGG